MVLGSKSGIIRNYGQRWISSPSSKSRCMTSSRSLLPLSSLLAEQLIHRKSSLFFSSSTVSETSASDITTTSITNPSSKEADNHNEEKKFDGDQLPSSPLIFNREPMAPYPLTTNPHQILKQAKRHHNNLPPSQSRYKHKKVPPYITRPSYANNPTGHVPYNIKSDQIMIHNETSIDKLRNAAKIARECLNLACDLAQNIGITTDEIDSIVHDTMIQKYNVYPSPLNYSGFPKSLCSSVNEVICHGIPDTRPLQYGDIASFDVSCYTNELMHGDNCATVIVGNYHDGVDSAGPNKEGNMQQEEFTKDWRNLPQRNHFNSKKEENHFIECRRLIHATRESMYAAIDIACKPGNCLSDIGNAIQTVADKYNYDTIKKYRGHGIHTIFHCAPFVKHYRNNHPKLELLPGMIFTIEPMITQKPKQQQNDDKSIASSLSSTFSSEEYESDDDEDNCYEWDDNWTVVTKDGGLSAQFEHMVLITETGAEILTTLDEKEALLYC